MFSSCLGNKEIFLLEYPRNAGQRLNNHEKKPLSANGLSPCLNHATLLHGRISLQPPPHAAEHCEPAPGLRTGDHVVISGYEAFGDAEVLEVSITE